MPKKKIRKVGRTDKPIRPVRGRIPSRQLFDPSSDLYRYDISNFHKTFVAIGDMTEYKAALKLVGSWQEWERLKRDWATFRSYIQEWKDELEVKLRSDAVEKIIELSSGEDSKALQAAKFLSESGWNKRAGAGRPSKAEKKRAAREIAKLASETKDEEARILKLVNGG